MKAQHCFPVLTFFFTFDKGTLCCGDNFWRLFNVRKCSRHITGTCSKNKGRLQSVGWHEWSCSLFPALQGTAYPCTLSLHHNGPSRLPKNGKQICWAVKQASKAFYGYLRAGVSGK